ncbi:MAG TPA: lysophospholipid acyltransferase family protein [Tepidiformaceae bacterium]|nr:lysophospholipid acyltransferase family protein [Tepidiformaceae bacterium]
MHRIRGLFPRAAVAAQYYAWRFVSAVVGRMPLRASYALATAIGFAGYYLWPRGRHSMRANYAVVMPHASKRERDRIARRSLVNYCHYLVDFVRFPRLPGDELIALAGGEEEFARLRREMESGRGVLIVCTHFGNWDAGAGACAARGFPANVVAESFGDERLDRMVAGSRERLGMRLIRIESPGPSLLRRLKAGEILAILIDRPVGDGVRVPFFGQEVTVPAGPARLALASGAKVMSAAFPRAQPGRPNVLTLCDWDIERPCTGDRDEDVRELTARILASHERFIRERPDQWYMFRRMWPAGVRR